jgi:hypothetical protein
MALSQYQVDPSTLNLSGKPAISTAPATPITSPGSTGMPGPVSVKESTSIPTGAGAALGALAGALLGSKSSTTGTTGTTPKPTTTPTTKPTTTPTTKPTGGLPGTTGSTTGTAGTDTSSQTFKTNPDGSITVSDKQGHSVTYDKNGQVIKSNVPGYTPDTTGVGSVDTTTGTTIGGMTGATSVIQTDANGNFVDTKTNEYVDPLGNNLFKDPNGNIINEAGTQVFPNYKPTPTGGTTPTTLPVDPTTGDPAGTTNIGNNYYQDTGGNIYDAGGNLIYQNPSPTGGGGYVPTDTTKTGSTTTSPSYYKDSNGDIYDSKGDLVLAYSHGYYYDPTTNDFYTSDFQPVDTSFNPYTDYYGIPSLDGSTGSSTFDTNPIDTGTVVKDGGSINKKAGGLATPLFKRGGKVRGYAAGGTSFTDQVVANQVPGSTATDTTATPTTTSTPSTTSTGSGVLNTLSNFVSNPAVSGALLGTLITQLLNSTGTSNVNKGVDMSKIGAIQPRTTTYGMGPAKFVPYSQYGTPPSQADYSQLYQNLGVSPNTAPAQPAAPAGGLPSANAPTTSTNPNILSAADFVSSGTADANPGMSYNDYVQRMSMPEVDHGYNASLINNLPIGNTPTNTTPPAQQYFSDANGNIYDANGDLVYDTTTSSYVGSAGAAVSPTTSATPTGGLSAMPATPQAINSYYTYGSDVTPSQNLKAKKGGIIKMANGGLMPQGNLNVPVSDKLNPHIPEVSNPIVNNRIDFRKGSYVEGPGDGQSDDIPAMLADGEYVIDAETVAQLGNGSNKAGAKMLDQFRENIRAHKRNTPLNKIPPKSKSPLAYLKGEK